MPEYIIRTADGDWPAVHRDRCADVLVPVGSDWRQVPGQGDFRMTSGDVIVAFSGEMVGWQVVVEGDISDEECDRLVETITAQVAAEVGEPCEWVRYD